MHNVLEPGFPAVFRPTNWSLNTKTEIFLQVAPSTGDLHATIRKQFVDTQIVS